MQVSHFFDENVTAILTWLQQVSVLVVSYSDLMHVLVLIVSQQRYQRDVDLHSRTVAQTSI